MAMSEEHKRKLKEGRERARAEKLAQRAAPALEETYVPRARKDDLVDVTINLAPNAEVLTTNGQQYWHGKTYRVSAAVARDLNDRMGATWRHENQIHGESENQYRRQTQRRLSERR